MPGVVELHDLKGEIIMEGQQKSRTVRLFMGSIGNTLYG